MENIGPGPALETIVWVTLSGQGEPPQQRATGRLAGLGAHRLLPVELEVAEELSTVSDFEITVSYQDVAGKLWQTVATYRASEGLYTDLELLPKLPVTNHQMASMMVSG